MKIPQLTAVIIGVIGVLNCQTVFAETDANPQPSLVEERVNKELQASDNPFVIMPHKVNYFLPITYSSSPNTTPFAAEMEQGDYALDHAEAKFQISFKFPLAYKVFGDNGHLFFAYTNQSWWQVYNKNSSSPFRETNHEPELFMLFNNDWKIGDFTNSFFGFGAVHQSNGRSGSLSRSWNRVYGNMVFDNGPMAFSLKVWWRIPESDKKYDGDPHGDDNPDIEDYLGHFEFTALYGPGKHRFSLMLRNNLKTSNNRGAAQLTWSYPILGNLRIYAQYFNGYGESLIDYNAHTERIGLGVALNDLL
ncbi:phospholipase A [Shewanella yunxiaonensis]|uniref:Phospholipase A1 n=1 Tax=Shewanella yunxiaonensis TaxID=2829809 RepID=A0ABX7YV38_9GAMM|nr:phospholipase A [Shewanella yunxiaonensis]QUN06505.1 phospholipase A [Shewanella yunxiaonensis]